MVPRLLTLLILFATVSAWGKPKAQPVPRPDWRYLEAQLKKAKFKKDFIKSLKQTYEEKHFQQALELNVLLYLRKHDDHGVQVSRSAVDTVKAFMEANRISLAAAEKDHGVSGTVIASLLWLESRHGENRGRFHVPSVYLHLLQAPRPEVVAHLKRASHNFAPLITQKNMTEIEKRSVKKAAWAVEELKALEKIHGRDRKRVRELRGSFAGAFGIPQFIPSSYLRWARTRTKAASPDLDHPQDAILSVAFYLKDNGWKRGRDKTFVKALLKYNNSNDYAQAILKLAEKVDGASRDRRQPAAKK